MGQMLYLHHLGAPLLHFSKDVVSEGRFKNFNQCFAYNVFRQFHDSYNIRSMPVLLVIR